MSGKLSWDAPQTSGRGRYRSDESKSPLELQNELARLRENYKRFPTQKYRRRILLLQGILNDKLHELCLEVPIIEINGE
jgi:hypothetical protein